MVQRANEVELPAIMSSTVEGLLHEFVWVVSIPVQAFVAVDVIAILTTLCPSPDLCCC
jgi:hypothetical protein